MSVSIGVLMMMMLFSAAADQPSINAANGTCCYICRNILECSRGCMGCWKGDSYCSSNEEICRATCGGAWCTGEVPIPPPPIGPTPPLSKPPHEKWNWTKTGIEPGRPTIDGDGVFVTAGNLLPNSLTGWVTRLSLETGKEEWTTNLTRGMEPANVTSYLHQAMSPVVADGHAYVQVDNFVTGPVLHALSVDRGEKVWNLTLGLRVVATGVTAGIGSVYFVRSDGHLVSHSASNGSFQWEFDVGNFSGDLTAPVLFGDVVYKAGTRGLLNKNYVFAVGAKSGSEKWPVSCRAAPWLPRVAVLSSMVIISTTYFDTYNPLPFGEPDGHLEAHDIKSGASRWSIDIPAAIGQPVVLEDDDGTSVVFFTACTKAPVLMILPHWWVGCTVWAVDASVAASSPMDSVLWRYTAPPNVALSNPQVRAGSVFIGTAEFVNGSWPNNTLPNCTWPPTQPLPNCTWPNITDWVRGEGGPEEAFQGNTTLPGYQNPSLVSLRASDGKLQWEHAVKQEEVFPGTWDELNKTLEELQRALQGDPEALGEVTSDPIAAELARAATGLPEQSASWSIAPWAAFTVDHDGKRLIYATAEGLHCLDISVPYSAEGDGAAIAAVAAAVAGVVVVGLAVVASVRLRCLRTNTLEEEALLSSDDENDKRSPESGPGDGPRGNLSAPEEQLGYEVVRQLGRGGFGTVYLVTHISTRELYSMKCIKCRCDRELRIARREVSLLHELPEHPGMIQVVESFSVGNSVYIILPFYEQGDLATFISTYPEPAIPEEVIISFVRQLCDVLDHLHSLEPPVVHRDLKPENILLTTDRQHLVVTDFGLARLVDKTYMHTHAGTLAFMAPEAFDGPYDTKVDIWSLGCIIYSMTTRRARNCRVMCVHVGRKGFHAEISSVIAERGYSPLIVDLVRQMLHPSRHARPSAEEILYRLGDDAPAPLRMGEDLDTAERIPPHGTSESTDGFVAHVKDHFISVDGQLAQTSSSSSDSANSATIPSPDPPTALPLGLLRGIIPRGQEVSLSTASPRTADMGSINGHPHDPT